MKFENFILSLPNFLPDNACDDIVNTFKRVDSEPERVWRDVNSQSERQDITMGGREVLREMIVKNEKGERQSAVLLFRETLNRALSLYLDKVPFFKDLIEHQVGYFNTDLYKWQQTPIGGGFHHWHHENLYDKKRELVWTLYLNDVEEGGETEFLYQHTRIKPKKGLFTIFPSSWTHMHRGNPPLSNEKYIGTGWYLFKFDEVRLFNLGMNAETSTFG
jgi:hypothetical protein